MRFRPPRREEGAALLAVLLLVAVMGALTASALERLKLSTALAINTAALDQARAFAIGLESLSLLRADDLVALTPEVTTNAGGWNNEVKQFALPGGGQAEARVRDGANCFNINSVASGLTPATLSTRNSGVDQFANLMLALQVPAATARHIAESAADWVDVDTNANPVGAEDSAYGGAAQPYRTGNTLFVDVSELRAVAGMTPEIYQRIRPWLCALLATDLSPININTLSIDQAPLLSMLTPERLPIEVARKVIAERPVQGWNNIYDFYRLPELQALNLPLDVQLQPQLKTRWFALDVRIEIQGSELIETALVDARIAPAKVAMRRWGSDD
jgi:general secretion pathway protein K